MLTEMNAVISMPSFLLSSTTVYCLIMPLASSFFMRSMTAETDILTCEPITDAFSLAFFLRHSIILISILSKTSTPVQRTNRVIFFILHCFR